MPRTAVSDVHAKVVGRELRETRRALGLTQAEVAGRLGVSPSYVSAVEAGKRNLTLAQLANIANAMRLGIEVSFIRPDGTPVRPSRTPATSWSTYRWRHVRSLVASWGRLTVRGPICVPRPRTRRTRCH
jgi:transcriptional regulator with XRE-family HTH domain